MSTYLGQNFLKDSAIKTYIAQAISKLYQDVGAVSLVEIGPGKGAITKKIKDISQSFFVIERDLLMKEYLSEVGLVQDQIIFGDVLEVDFHQDGVFSFDPNSTLIVGNLPYYITSPIFRKFFTGDQLFAGGIFMIQDEVGLKIISSAQKKSYLWRLLNWGYEITYLKMVPPKCFSPAPKVKSCLVKFVKKSQSECVDFSTLEKFLNLFAPYSRKTLGRIAKLVYKQTGDLSFVLPEQYQTKRLEELSWNDLIQILGKCDA